MMSTRQNLPDSLPVLEFSGSVATIRLSRPKKLNRLSPADLWARQEHCRRINEASHIRIAVLTADTQGQERPVFCAGYEVSAFDSGAHHPRLFETTVELLAGLRPVLICGLNGSVFGGATDMVLACDLRIGRRGLVFKMPAVALGLHYYPSGLQRYVHAFGLEGARQAFLGARQITGEHLLNCGVLTDLCNPEDYEEAMDALVTHVGALAPLAAQGTKRSLLEIAQGHFNEPLLRQREALTLGSHDFAEGRAAFAQKRTPQFKGI